MASIRCGNCKGTHESSSEVRACYQGKQESMKRHPAGRAPAEDPLANDPDAIRIIARAKHTNGGKRCTGAVSRLVVPSSAQGVESIRNRDARGWLLASSPAFWKRWFWRGNCPECGRFSLMKGIPVEGKYNPDRPCDPRCMDARGPNCSCACGGINHGAGYATTR